jgi:hypothetical protein
MAAIYAGVSATFSVPFRLVMENGEQVPVVQYRTVSFPHPHLFQKRRKNNNASRKKL